ncbi:thymidine kinase cytosolic [Anaeramoeba flamelloides]|uniref:thymidine kinase n=1 Tax=Anaeramoeba flamelloides TaxID=1746091 RepID=A0AAV7ZBP0_9EUKA|nr:thymidine kinase cytosolic [Anaeramoeba flamelloides]
MNFEGHIELILGPIFSGKTSELIRRINRFSYASKKCLILKFSEESENEKKSFKTHSGYDYKALATDTLDRVSEQVKEFQVIGIDDGQFFPKIADFAEKLANEGKVVLIAALDGTFERKPFGCITQLIPRCENLVKLGSVCMVCYKEGSFSKRTTNEKQVKLLGGTEKYISVCRREYFESKSHKKENEQEQQQQQQENENENENGYTYDGQIQLILGPMFGGKSSELIRRSRKYSFANKKCTVIKFARDVRYSVDKCSTHDRVMMDAVPCTGKLFDVEDKVKDYDVIGIDEGQFFEDIVEFSEHMANKGKVIIIAALDGTFERKPFGRVLELVSKAEQVIKLNAVCTITYKDAAFTKRTSQEKEVQVIGGIDKYVAVSREGYFIAQN